MVEEGVIAHLRKIFQEANAKPAFKFSLKIRQVENDVVAVVRAHKQQLQEARERLIESQEECRKDLKQSHFDSMTLLQRNAQNYAVFSAMIGVYDEMLKVLGGVEP